MLKTKRVVRRKMTGEGCAFHYGGCQNQLPPTWLLFYDAADGEWRRFLQPDLAADREIKHTKLTQTTIEQSLYIRGKKTLYVNKPLRNRPLT